MTRGLTLIETLVSVALLGGLVAAFATWTGLAGRLSAAGSDARTATEVEAALRLIEDEVLCGDLEIAIDERIQVETSALRLKTRVRIVGSVTTTYAMDPRTHRLVRRQESVGVDSESSLLEDIVQFIVAFDAEARALDLTVVLADSVELTKGVRVP